MICLIDERCRVYNLNSYTWRDCNLQFYHSGTCCCHCSSSGPAFALISSPASLPIFRASSMVMAPVREASTIWVPSGDATRPRNCMSPFSSLWAWPAIGVRHEPSSAARNARSHTTAMRVSSWFSAERYSSSLVSPVLFAIPMAPAARTQGT
eukprot:scaffold1690_cov366-Prasinococcus_capsulatus_cf.AAC.3